MFENPNSEHTRAWHDPQSIIFNNSLTKNDARGSRKPLGLVLTPKKNHKKQKTSTQSHWSSPQTPTKLCACFFLFWDVLFIYFVVFRVLWIFDFFVGFLGVRTSPNGFLDLLASFLVKELLKMMDWGSCHALVCSEFGFSNIHRLFGALGAWFPEPLCSRCFRKTEVRVA